MTRPLPSTTRLLLKQRVHWLDKGTTSTSASLTPAVMQNFFKALLSSYLRHESVSTSEYRKNFDARRAHLAILFASACFAVANATTDTKNTGIAFGTPASQSAKHALVVAIIDEEAW